MGHAVGRLLGSRGFAVVTALAGRSERTRGLAARAGDPRPGRHRGGGGGGRPGAVDPAAARRRSRPRRRPQRPCRPSGATPPFADLQCDLPRHHGAHREADPGRRSRLHRRRHHRRAAGQRQRAAVLRLRPGRAPAAAAAGGRLGGARPGRRDRGARRRSRCATRRSPRAPSALQFAQLAAASRLGVDEALAGELGGEPRARSTPRCGARLPGLPAKAPRWIEEMRQIAATFESVGVPGQFHHGAAALYELLSATPRLRMSPRRRWTPRAAWRLPWRRWPRSVERIGRRVAGGQPGSRSAASSVSNSSSAAWRDSSRAAAAPGVAGGGGTQVHEGEWIPALRECLECRGRLRARRGEHCGGASRHFCETGVGAHLAEPVLAVGRSRPRGGAWCRAASIRRGPATPATGCARRPGRRSTAAAHSPPPAAGRRRRCGGSTRGSTALQDTAVDNGFRARSSALISGTSSLATFIGSPPF